VGTRSDIMQLCTSLVPTKATATYGGVGGEADGPPTHTVVQCGEGGAVTQWSNAAVLYINAGRYRNGPSSRYRNRFWRDERGTTLMSWFPGRGHRLSSASIVRLTSGQVPLLLFCRRAPSHPYWLCGRLQPVAFAQPASLQPNDEAQDTNADADDARGGASCGGEGCGHTSSVGADGGDGSSNRGASCSDYTTTPGPGPGLPVWTTVQAAHVVFRLLDAQALDEAFEAVLGGRTVEKAKPACYNE